MLSSKVLVSFVGVFALSSIVVNGQATGYKQTAKDNEAIAKLRALTGTLTPKYLNEDFILLKFLRDKNFDVNAAHQSIKDTIAWRKTNKIETIKNEKILPDLFPYQIKGHDKTGRPVIYIAPARWDVRKVIVAGQRDLLVRKWAQFVNNGQDALFETRNSTEFKDKEVRETVLVMDLHGYNLRQHGCLSCFSLYFEWTRMYEKYFSQQLGAFYMINTPRIFQPLLELLRGVFTPHTNKILKVLGPKKDEWLKELLTIIDEDELLEFYGGKKP